MLDRSLRLSKTRLPGISNCIGTGQQLYAFVSLQLTQRIGRRDLTASFSTPSTMLEMTFSTVLLWFPVGLSSLNRIIRHCDMTGSQWTSTILSSTCVRVAFNLFIERQSQITAFENRETYFSHSSSSTYITSYSSYFGPDRSSPHQTWRRKNGFAQKSGFVGSSFSGGNRRTSLKSIEFSDGGFHFRLDA